MGSKLDRYQHVFVLLVIMLNFSGLEAATIGLQPEGTQCACAGDMLTYNCSVMGGIITLWRGTTFDCPMSDSEITLRHSLFASSQDVEICNNGDIVGHSIGVVNDCYTSQLNVTVRENFNNRTVQCAFTSNAGTRAIGESLLSVASANLYPPDKIYLTDAQPGKLVFNWTPVISNCSTLYVQYDIISDCGTCPTVTNTTTATCSNLQLSTNAVMCQFSVSSRACGLVGNSSSPTAVILKVPGIPKVKVIPSYSNGSQALLKLFITTVNQTEDDFYISCNISGSPTSYNIHTFNLVSDVTFNSALDLSCEEDIGCEVQLPSSYCPQLTIINVTVSAANKLGEGPPSKPFMIECTNNFVQAQYIEVTSESAISCKFLNPLDTSEKICCITHRRCDDNRPDSVQKCKTDPPYNIPLEISDRSSQRYCYTISASNGTHTVKVEGNFSLGDSNRGFQNESNNIAAVVAGVVVSSIFILLVIIIVVVGMIMRARQKRWQPQQERSVIATVLPIIDAHSLKHYLLSYHLPPTLKLYKIPRDCQLREYMTKTLPHVVNKHGFRRGHTYYEFTNEIENILEGKKVLLQDKINTEKWFQLAPPSKEITAGRLKLYGEGISRSSFGDQYRVFIQSFGSGARHLPSGSSFLYDHSEDQVEPDILPLVPLCSEHFAHKVIDSEEGLSAQQFCTQNGLSTAAFNLFLTVEHLPKELRDQPPRDVILMDRVSRELFTGPYARQVLDHDPRNGDESQHENEKWKMFVPLEKSKKSLVFNKGSEILYQDSNYHTGNYMVLDVDSAPAESDDDRVRLSKFIETKLGCQYEDGNAFYEVTENEEDLLYYKKILRPKKNELSCKELKLQSLIEYFYAIPGVPSLAVKPEHLRLKGDRFFIQSTSQGSRCLKKGEKILYLN